MGTKCLNTNSCLRGHSHPNHNRLVVFCQNEVNRVMAPFSLEFQGLEKNWYYDHPGWSWYGNICFFQAICDRRSERRKNVEGMFYNRNIVSIHWNPIQRASEVDFPLDCSHKMMTVLGHWMWSGRSWSRLEWLNVVRVDVNFFSWLKYVLRCRIREITLPH